MNKVTPFRIEASPPNARHVTKAVEVRHRNCAVKVSPGVTLNKTKREMARGGARAEDGSPAGRERSKNDAGTKNECTVSPFERLLAETSWNGCALWLRPGDGARLRRDELHRARVVRDAAVAAVEALGEDAQMVQR